MRVDDPARVAPLMREIDEQFRNSEAVTASETEKSYFATMVLTGQDKTRISIAAASGTKLGMVKVQ